MCGILPCRNVSGEWLSHALAMNSFLADHCKDNGWTFVDNWNTSYGRNTMLARDGVHLSRRGVSAFAASLEWEVDAFFRAGRELRQGEGEYERG